MSRLIVNMWMTHSSSDTISGARWSPWHSWRACGSPCRGEGFANLYPNLESPRCRLLSLLRCDGGQEFSNFWINLKYCKSHKMLHKSQALQQLPSVATVFNFKCIKQLFSSSLQVIIAFYKVFSVSTYSKTWRNLWADLILCSKPSRSPHAALRCKWYPPSSCCAVQQCQMQSWCCTQYVPEATNAPSNINFPRPSMPTGLGKAGGRCPGVMPC